MKQDKYARLLLEYEEENKPIFLILNLLYIVIFAVMFMYSYSKLGFISVPLMTMVTVGLYFFLLDKWSYLVTKKVENKLQDEEVMKLYNEKYKEMMNDKYKK